MSAPRNDTLPRLRLSVLGGFELRNEAGQLLRLPTRKTEALLAFLAVDPRHTHRREALAAMLWGDASEAAALASLRQGLSLIGKACGRPLLLGAGREVGLDRAALELDASSFEAACDQADAQALAQGIALYRGELLAGLLLNEPPFDDWLRGWRQRLHEKALQATLRLAQSHNAAGDLDAAVQAGLRALELDPLHEAGHRLLMELQARQGRRAAALRQYQVCVDVLRRELGTEPEAATRTLYNRLLRQPQASVATAARAAPTTPEAAPTVHEAPLIGREVELATLLGALRQARARQGRLVALLGEAGLGKTRLAEELAARAQAQGVRVLIGRCHESQQLYPLAPWIELLRRAGVPADAPLLAALAPAWRGDLLGLLPEIGPGEAAPDGESAALGRQARLFEAVMQVLALLAARGPLLLVLDDLHWGDEISLRLLAALTRRAAGWALLTVVTAREEELASAPALRRTLRELDPGASAPTVTRMPLSSLSRQQTGALVAALQGAATGKGSRVESTVDSATGATEALSGQVWAVSEGNPFVVVEAMRARQVDAHAQGVSGLSLPERVRELVLGQLERLGPQARHLLALLALAGRETDFRLLQRAADLPEQEAAQALEELVRRRLLQLVGEAFDTTHARVRQVVAETLLPPARRLLHAALARAIEAAHADGATPMIDRLAYHYARTDLHPLAVRHLTMTAQRAAHDGAHSQALELLQQAQAHAARLAPDEALARRHELLLAEARSLFFLGRFGEVLDLLLPLQAAIDAAGDAATAAAYYLRRGSTRTYLGDHAAAVADAERALQEATASRDTATMGKAHFLLSLEHFWARPRLGVEHGEQAVALLAGTAERWWTGQACWILGLNLSYRGRFSEGLAMQARAAALADSTGDRRLASYAAWTTGFIHALAGDLGAAVPACRRSVELALDPLNRMTSLGILSLALVERGDAAEALQCLDEAIPQAGRFGIPQMHGLFLAFRGEALLLQGDVTAARTAALQGAAITRDAGYRYGLGWAQRVLARIARRAGDAVQMSLDMAQAVATFTDMEAPFEAARTQQEWAQWLAADEAATATTASTPAAPGSAPQRSRKRPAPST